MDSRDKSPPRNIAPDLIIPVLALVFTAYYMTTITEVPWISQASAVTVGGLLTLAILAYLVRSASRIRKGTETLRWRPRVRNSATAARRIALLGLTVGYVFVSERLGFTLTTAAFIFLGVVLLSSPANWKRAALVAAGCSVAGYIVFIYFFETRFPRGPVENLLKGLL